MSPTHVKKGNVRYHYYQSWVLAQGQKSKAGSVDRVPALEVERAVIAQVLENCGKRISSETEARMFVRGIVQRVEVLTIGLKLTIKPTSNTEDESIEVPPEMIVISWTKPSNTRKREILCHQDQSVSRPIRPEARTRLLKAIAQGRYWLDMLVNGNVGDICSLAATHNLSEKTIRSTISLAFLAPNIVQATIDGKLSRGLGVSQMTDLPANWAQQHYQLGIG